jgi:hypothetical protein
MVHGSWFMVHGSWFHDLRYAQKSGVDRRESVFFITEDAILAYSSGFAGILFQHPVSCT